MVRKKQEGREREFIPRAQEGDRRFNKNENKPKQLTRLFNWNYYFTS